MFFNKNTIIFCGYFGSGKTELSINYALRLAENQYKTALIDLDIVNPYFRSRDEKQFLETRGIIVASSSILSAGSDLPALSPKILGLLQQKDMKIIIDVGGDDVGAKVLRRFKRDIDGYELIMVINVFRPFTEDKEGILKIIESIQKSSGMCVTGLINNSNLGNETTIEHLIRGMEIIKKIESETGIPLKFHCLNKELINAALEYGLLEPILPLSFFMVPVWLKN